ncbi:MULTISPECIES: polysaccharide lyase family 7 protein [Pseudomonas]|uniref:Alginate lyase n=1 Tax=Pseudomonas kilonensis TaxID=132476 RepID=A0ABY0YT11_9PSED|nr:MULTISPECIES: polysaccharide lyase family 7 protein [Pseudomonas]EPJ79200.1 putative lyase [Pseudomonas sp. CFII68]OOG86433.1 polysaccharide lyase family 7 protein [Pseudomonas sp. A25(2017)]SED95042.1 Alginate lyase [Pseudomonas kilonensis]
MIDLATWNLSIPEGAPPATIETSQLVQGFKNQYFNSETGTVFFWAPVTGATTANAIYPRSELRETNSDGTLRNWLYPSADNTLRATVTVNQVPSTGKIVIGQIHTKDSTSPMVKLEYQYKAYSSTGNIVAKVRIRPDDATGQVITIATGVTLNRSFSYMIHLSPKGALGITAAGYNWRTTVDPSWKVKPLYFKAGVYVQDNTGYVTEGGKVTFSLLEIKHTTL